MTLQVQAKSQQNSIVIQIQFPNASTYENISYNFEMFITIYLQQLPSFSLKKVYQKKFVVMKNNLKIEALEFSKNYKVNVKVRGGGKQWLQKNIFVCTPSREIDFEQHQGNQRMQSSQDFSEYQYLGRRQTAKIPLSQENLSNNNQNEDNQENNYRRSTFSTGKYNNSSFDRTKNRTKTNTSIGTTKQLCNSQIMMKMIGQTTSLVNKKELQKYILEGRKCRNMKQFINQKQKLTNQRKVLEKKVLLAQGISVFNDIYKNKEGMTFFKNDWFMGPFYSYDGNEDRLKKF